MFLFVGFQSFAQEGKSDVKVQPQVRPVKSQVETPRFPTQEAPTERAPVRQGKPGAPTSQAAEGQGQTVAGEEPAGGKKKFKLSKIGDALDGALGVVIGAVVVGALVVPTVYAASTAVK